MTMQVQLGRYQTRLSRIVEIRSSRMVEETQADGTKQQKRIWTGMMFRADGRSPDSDHEWEDSGALRNQRGVTSPMDLTILVQPHGPAPGSESAPFLQVEAAVREISVPASLPEGATYVMTDAPWPATLEATPLMSEGRIQIGPLILSQQDALTLQKTLGASRKALDEATVSV